MSIDPETLPPEMSFEQPATPPSKVKPFFLPAGFDCDALSLEVRLAIEALVTPIYEEMVMGAPTLLERSTASSFAILAMIELDAQLEVGAALNFTGKATPAEREERDQLINRLLRLVGAKQRTAQFLHRLQTIREKLEGGDGC